MCAKAVLPMESYRLAQYAVHVPCFVCDEGNAFDAELCRRCYAPMSLVNQSSQNKDKHKSLPLMIATVGSTGAGKTVYLGILMDILSRQDASLQLTAKGAFSIGLQERTMAALTSCEFPEKTPGEPDRWNWVHGHLRSGQYNYELVMPDMAGEAILQEADHPNTYPVVRAMMKKSSGVLLLIDAVRIEEGADDQDYFGMKILSYLDTVWGGVPDERQKKRKKKHSPNPPVAIVLTKSDQCEVCFEDPAAYARKGTPGLWQQCQENFPNHRFFAIGVAGACGARLAFGKVKQNIPLRVEPRGVIDPFRWLIEQSK